MKRLRTKSGNKSGFYVCEIRGAVFISWVFETERDNALEMHHDKAFELQQYILNTTGVETEIVDA